MTRFFHILQRFEAFLIAWSIIAIAVLNIVNIFCRAVMGFSVSFIEEVSQILMIAVTFIGLSYAASRGRHIRMTAIYDQLGQAKRKFLMITISGVTALLMLALAWYAVEYIGTVRFLESVSPVLQIPLHWIYWLVPCGLTLAAIQYALTVIKNLSETEVYVSYERKDEYEEPVTGEV